MNKFLIEKKKFPQTSKNSRQNSGEKQIITRIMSLKHNKLIAPNSAGGNIKSAAIKKKKTNNIINNKNGNIGNKVKSIDKINDINNNKIMNHNNYLIPNVNINIDKNLVEKNKNKSITNKNSQEKNNQKLGNNLNNIDLMQKALYYNNYNNLNKNNNNINSNINNNNANLNYNNNNSNLNNENNNNNNIKNNKNNSNNSNNFPTKFNDYKLENKNYYSNENNIQNENKFEQILKEEKIFTNKKKILLGKNYITNLPPSTRQIILNTNKMINNNQSTNNNNNVNNNNVINSKGIEPMKKTNMNHKNKFVNNNNNNLNNKIINNENNSLEEIKNQNKNAGFNKGLIVNRKILTATNSPSHSIQLNNFNNIINNNNNNNINNNNINNNNINNNFFNKKPKINYLKNINNYISNNSNNSNINNINGNNTNSNSNSNTNKNDSSEIAYAKPINRDIVNSNEILEKNKKNQKINEKNTIPSTSGNNTENSRKNTTGKIKKNNEKKINKNKIHNFINNHNIINGEQAQNVLFNPHHNTLRSTNNSINKEKDKDKENSITDEKDNDSNKNGKKTSKIANNINNIKKNNQKITKNENILNIDNINCNLNINNYLNDNNNKEKEKIINKEKIDKSLLLQKQKEKIKLDKLSEKIISGKLINKKVNNKSIGANNIKNNKIEDNNKILDKEKIEQLLLNKEKLIEYNKKINNNKYNINLNVNEKNDSKKPVNQKVKIKIAKKSTHNRNTEQNFILNNRTNTSVLSTMKDSNYYNHECEKLSKYIKEYYKQNLSYPNTDLSFYKYGRIIGRGAFGKVNIGLNILTGRIVAIKSFNKKNIINESSKKKILYETNLMRGLFHPSVTKILETFESEKYMLIIMEYISGGNLQNFVKKRRKLCEKTAKILFRQIIQGIKYIHSRGIVHRDIKLENILLDLNNIIKICDFGVGKLIKPNTILKDQCGTPVYMAPEIIKGEGYHGFPVDIWSAGVALYIMLSGSLPFNKDKEHNLEYSILNKNIKEISDISEEANNLLKNILEKDPNKRYTANQILEHPWMNTNLNDEESNDYDYNNEIKNVNKYHLFTNAESILLAKTHIDYRNAQKKDLAENFTIKNLYTIDEKSKKNVDTKSAILAPYNSMLTDYDENDENPSTNNSKRNNKSKNSSKINPNELLDNYNNELEIKNGLIKFHGKAKEFNMNYELNNNEEIDNGMLINSKNELISIEDKQQNNDNNIENDKDNDNDKNIYLRKKNNNINKMKNSNIPNKKKHRPSSPYRPPPINKDFVKMVSDLGYDEEYVTKSLEKNQLNHATAIYYLFSNYENVK